ncbi:MAG: YwiC-like family protein, partial [bacterium]
MRARRFAIPHEHGAWALWLGPFLVGWGVAGGLSWPLLWTFLAVLFVFLARHPMMILVRALSGRRKREDAGPAAFWMSVYLVAALLFALLLVLSGHPLLLLL